MDTTIFDLATIILECSKSALEEDCGYAPDRACVIVGPIPWDDCCAGQLYVTVDRVYGSLTFPDEALVPNTCVVPFTAVDFTVQLMQCAVTPSDDGDPPTCKELAASAKSVYSNARALWKGVQCCLFEQRDTYEHVMRNQIFIGDGACIGSQLSVTVGINDGCVC
jgi:hypothetical protein